MSMTAPLCGPALADVILYTRMVDAALTSGSPDQIEAARATGQRHLDSSGCLTPVGYGIDIAAQMARLPEKPVPSREEAMSLVAAAEVAVSAYRAASEAAGAAPVTTPGLADIACAAQTRSVRALELARAAVGDVLCVAMADGRIAARTVWRMELHTCAQMRSALAMI